MFNNFLRFLFAMSSASPMLVVVGFIYHYNTSDTARSLLVGGVGVILFTIGGFFFLRFAQQCGEAICVEDFVFSIAPSGQWLPVLFGSYLVPLVSLFETALSLEWVVFITFALVVVALLGQNIPPALFLLLFGYKFYDLSFKNGAGGYKLISKKRTIDDPHDVKSVARLFDNDYWLIEK